MTISERIGEIMPRQELLNHLIAYAKIDFIMHPKPDDDWIRVYHYDKTWVPDGHFIKIDNSGGDHYHILFSPAGCIIKGFDHESDVSPYNLEDGALPDCIAGHDFYSDAPAGLAALLDDPALEKHLVTFCAWQGTDDAAWRFAPSSIPKDWNDGIDTFLAYAHDLKRHREWFEEYYESVLDEETLQSIFVGNPITKKQIEAMDPDANPKVILECWGKEF